MDEKQENKAKESAKAVAHPNDGQRQTSEHETIVDKARHEREALMAENDRMEKNIKELRDLEAARLLGPTSGGRVESAPPKEESAKEYAENVLAGKVKAQ